MFEIRHASDIDETTLDHRKSLLPLASTCGHHGKKKNVFTPVFTETSSRLRGAIGSPIGKDIPNNYNCIANFLIDISMDN